MQATRQQSRETEQLPILVPLEESELTVDPEQDIRGRKVVDSSGEVLGTVDELLVDPADRKVRLVRLKGGGILGLGDRHWLVPVDAITDVGEEAIRINLSGQRIATGPAYGPELLERPRLDELFERYGYPPFWGPGYVYPPWFMR